MGNKHRHVQTAKRQINKLKILNLATASVTFCQFMLCQFGLFLPAVGGFVGIDLETGEIEGGDTVHPSGE